MCNLYWKCTFGKFYIFLVKFLNFKIITVYNSLEKDLNKLTENIKKKQYHLTHLNYFYWIK